MAQLVKDVVCGMMIDPATAAATSAYKGATYYFCAGGCKVDFDKDPEKYLSASHEPAAMSSAKPARRWWEFWKSSTD
jgi:YHS domain-containing protein